VPCTRRLCGIYDIYWKIKNRSAEILYSLFNRGDATAGVFVPKLVSGYKKWGLDHIKEGHWHNSTKPNKSKFLKSIDEKGLENLINEAVHKSQGWRIDKGSFVLEVDMGRIIGLDPTGKATRMLRIVADAAGNVISAYPIP